MTHFILENSLGHLLGRTFRALANLLHTNFKDAGKNITPEQWGIMANLWLKDGLNQQELADATIKDKTSITRMIDSLEKRNYLIRVPDQQDKRNKRIFLTTKGKDLQHELVTIALTTLTTAQSGISDEELKQCKATLDKIFYNIKEHKSQTS